MPTATTTQPHGSTAHYRQFRAAPTSRARANLALGLPELRLDAAELKRHMTPRAANAHPRVMPSSSIVSLVALVVFALGALVVKSAGTFAVVRGEIRDGTVIVGDARGQVADGVVVGSVSVGGNESEVGERRYDGRDGMMGGGKNETKVENGVDVGRVDGMVMDDEAEEEEIDAKGGEGREDGQLERSWPRSEEEDVAGLMPLARHLNFTNETMLNYFHMHKTGGVTTKVELMNLLNSAENKRLMTKRGQRMRYLETCYQTEVIEKGDEKSIEGMWRCDFGQIENMTEEEKAGVDILLGHQYWERGCDEMFGRKREVKHFSIFRHPLARKLSFYYHFFVRNVGRDEKGVGKEEIIKFLLGEDLSNELRLRDAGPNYYASRLLSDGIEGFKNHQYMIEEAEREGAMRKAMDRLDSRFAFVGLQVQAEASQCMLRKAVEVLAHAHGIDEMQGTSRLAESRSKLNVGEYVWTARKVWDAMSDGERRRFEEVERVDLAIYNKAVERFKKDVEVFRCGEKVKEEEWGEDVYV